MRVRACVCESSFRRETSGDAGNEPISCHYGVRPASKVDVIFPHHHYILASNYTPAAPRTAATRLAAVAAVAAALAAYKDDQAGREKLQCCVADQLSQ